MDLELIFKGCYKKLKSLVYYSSSMAFFKDNLACFESSEDKFNISIQKLAKAVADSDDYFFKKLVEKTSLIAVPKNAKNALGIEGDSVVTNTVNKDGPVYVEAVNFLVDVPVEMLLVDIFVTLELGLGMKKAGYKDSYCYANGFHSDCFLGESQINYSNSSLFSYYFSGYRKWKNEAIDAAEKLKQNNQDCTLVSLDITGYFYHFNKTIGDVISSYVGFFEKPNGFDYCVDVLQLVFDKYKDLVSKYRCDVNDLRPLPIGLNISSVLANLYLSSFDRNISKKTESFCRYVDDILIVIKGCDVSTLEGVCKKFPDLLNFKDKKGYICEHPELFFKNDKIKIFNIYAKGMDDTLEKMKSKEFRVSEYRLFPSFNANVDDLLSKLFIDEELIKIREFDNSVVNPGKITVTTNGMALSFKGVTQDGKSSKVLQKYRKELLETLKNADLVRIWNKWEKLFVLFGYLNKYGVGGEHYQRFEKAINRTQFSVETESDYNRDSAERLTALIKRSLRRLKQTAVTGYFALIGNYIEKDATKESVQRFRDAGFIDKTAVVFPMLSYVKALPFSINLATCALEKYVDYVGIGFDSFKVNYSPVFIPLNNYMWAKQLYYIVNNISFNLNDITKEYNDCVASVNDYLKTEIEVSDLPSLDGYTIKEIRLKDGHFEPVSFIDPKSIYVACSEIDLDKMNIVKGKRKATLVTERPFWFRKEDFIELLNKSYLKDFSGNRKQLLLKNQERADEQPDKNVKFEKYPVSFVLLPEAFVPIEWLDIVSKFCKETLSTIIFGIRYIVYKGVVFNMVGTEMPFVDNKGHRSSITVLRPKNKMPLYEKVIIKNTGKLVPYSSSSDLYYLLNNQGITFAPLVCYEATDIVARAHLKNRVEYVFTVEFNMDTEYFQNIAMSCSRDLFCYYFECNSSKYGSTYFAPYHNYLIPIGHNKGNSDSGMQIIKTDIDHLRVFKKEYNAKYATSSYMEEDDLCKKPSANTK